MNRKIETELDKFVKKIESILEQRSKENSKKCNEIMMQMSSLYEQIELLRDELFETRRELELQICENGIYKRQLNDLVEDHFSNLAYLISLSTQNYSITKTDRFEHDFFWITDMRDSDMISKYVRNGFCGETIWDGPDETLWRMFPDKGTILDIGANIGAFCFPLACKGWRGYAIEASKHNANLMSKTIAINGFDIKICNKAVSDFCGEISFYQDGPQGFIEDEVHINVNYETVQAISLDCYAEDETLHDIESLDLIKMDIEGAEVRALKGMHQFIEKVGFPVIYAEINVWTLYCMGFTPRNMFEELWNLGYIPYRIIDGKLYSLTVDFVPECPCEDYFFIKGSSFLDIYIAGEYIQEEEKVINRGIWYLEDMKNRFVVGDFDEEKLLPHIAFYRYCQEYCLFKDNPIIIALRQEIADLLSETENVVFTKMVDHLREKG